MVFDDFKMYNCTNAPVTSNSRTLSTHSLLLPTFLGSPAHQAEARGLQSKCRFQIRCSSGTNPGSYSNYKLTRAYNVYNLLTVFNDLHMIDCSCGESAFRKTLSCGASGVPLRPVFMNEARF